MAYKYNVRDDFTGEKVKVKDLWTGFKDDTTAHGIPHVSNAPGKCKKILWLVVSLIACGLLIFHLYTVITTFMKFNTTVKISIRQEHETDFPSVTVCNLNPIKRSALHLDSVLEELLSDDSRRRKRKKRYLGFPCTDEQIYDPLGMCYAAIDQIDDQDGAKSHCNDEDANLYMPINVDIESLISQSSILYNVSFNQYWIYMRNDEWGDRVPPPYTNYYTSHGNEDAAIAVISEGHQWREYDKRQTDGGVLCQKMIACPNRIYTDPDGDTICWFMPYGETEAKWESAKHACSKFAKDSYLVELDTEAKYQYLVGDWTILSTLSGQRYWLNLKMDANQKWQESHQLVADTWSNWAQNEPALEHQGTVADRSNNHLWSTNAHNNDDVTAMIICEKRGLQYNGYVAGTAETTTAETTISDTTTEAITAAYETTLPDTTTESIITTQETTVPDTTTEAITTAQDTTLPDTTTMVITTAQETTLPDTTTVAITTAQETTLPDTTTHAITTSQETTLADTTTVAITTAQETTLAHATTNAITTAQETTLPDTTTEAITTAQETTLPSTTTEALTTSQTTTLSDTTIEALTTAQATTLPDTTTDVITAAQQTTLPDTTTDVITAAQETTLPDTTAEAQTTTTGLTTSYSTTMTATSTTTEPSSIEGRPPLSEEFVLAETVIENLAIISQETKTALGYDPYEFILDCQYEGWICDISMFYQIYDPIFGNCYLFNSGWNSSISVQQSHRTGRRYGLSLVLNIAEDEYLSNIGGATGVRVVVHHQHSMPHPDEDGLLAKPGELTSIGVRKVIYKKKPAPYGTCTKSKKYHQSDVYSEKYRHVHYSKKNCYRTCYQRHVIKRCGCADSYYPMEGKALQLSSPVLPCDTRNREQDDCRYGVNLDYTSGQLGCSKECPEPCDDIYFETSISTAVWPSSSHAGSIEEKYGDRIPGVINSTDSDALWKNVLNVEVFYNDFNYEKISEKESYKTGQFVSDLGGILGLWIGCSVITIFEFFELGLDLIVLGCVNAVGKCRKPKKKAFSGSTQSAQRDRQKDRKRRKGVSVTPVHDTQLHSQADATTSISMSRTSPDCSTPRSNASSGFFDEHQDIIPGVPDSAGLSNETKPRKTSHTSNGRTNTRNAKQSHTLNDATNQRMPKVQITLDDNMLDDVFHDYGAVQTPRGVDMALVGEIDSCTYLDDGRPPEW